MSLKVKGTRLMVALFLCVSVLGQAPPGSRAAQRLEEYRQSKAAALRDDFGELVRYRAANASLKPAASDEKRVVFFGDSITDMWNLAEYFPGKPYINRGISGQTTPQMLLRFRQDVIALQPHVVVILAGTNDIAGNTGPMSLEDIEGNLSSMSQLAHANGIRVVLSSVLPVYDDGHTSDGKPLIMTDRRPPERILALNAWIKNYAAQQHDIYLDYFAAMVDGNGSLKDDLSDD